MRRSMDIFRFPPKLLILNGLLGPRQLLQSVTPKLNFREEIISRTEQYYAHAIMSVNNFFQWETLNPAFLGTPPGTNPSASVIVGRIEELTRVLESPPPQR
jgi:hypothetical protein